MNANADADIVVLDDRLPQYRSNLTEAEFANREGATNSTRSALRSPKFTPRFRASCADSRAKRTLPQGGWGKTPNPCGCLPLLRGGFQPRSRDAAQLKQPDQCFLDQVIGTRGASGDADYDRTGRQPEMGNYFTLLVQIVMLDLGRGDQTRSIQNKISGQFFFAHFGEVRGIGAVVTAHHQQQIHRNVEQFAQRILPLLGRAADGIEKSKILRRFFHAITIDDRLSYPSLHFLGLAPQ